jgi:hypothetical protein
VGYSSSDIGSVATYWTEALGNIALGDLLIAHGADSVRGWRLEWTLGVSANGQTLVGYGYNPARQVEAWAATIPELNTWRPDAGGNWSNAENWTTDIPQAPGSVALFKGPIPAPAAVTTDIPVTVGYLGFHSANAYTIAGPGTITLENKSGNAHIAVTGGNHTITAPIALSNDTLISVAPTNSTLAITGPFSATGRNVTKSGAGTLTLSNIRVDMLRVKGGAIVIAPNGSDAGTSVFDSAVGSGGIDAWSTKLDFTDNDAVFHLADFNMLYNQLKVGFDRGSWSGFGFISSAAATNPNLDTTLAIARNGFFDYREFSGQSVTRDSILLKYTYYGDIDLNGAVDANDLTIFARNFGKRTQDPMPERGDLDYNGRVDADDLTLFANNFGKGTGNPLGSGGVQTVPEPATLLLAAPAAICAAWICLRRNAARVQSVLGNP